MNIPPSFWKTINTFVCVLIALGAVLIIKDLKSISYVGANPTQTNTITVDGTGDAFAAPDIATFSFTVTATAKTVADAQTAATAKNNAALKALKDGGVADKDVQTTSYDINPHYDTQSSPCTYNTVSNVSGYGSASSGVMIPGTAICPPSKQVLTGYDVSQTTSVKIRDLSKAGDLFTAVGALGVQSVYGFQFAIDNPDSINAAARSKAIADAKTKADQLASQLGVRLVRVTSFNENNGSVARPLFMDAMASGAVATKAPAPEIASGQQKVTDSVTITYEIR